MRPKQLAKPFRGSAIHRRFGSTRALQPFSAIQEMSSKMKHLPRVLVFLRRSARNGKRHFMLTIHPKQERYFSGSVWYFKKKAALLNPFSTWLSLVWAAQ